MRTAIIQSHFYRSVVDELCRGATAVLREAGVSFDVISVPGALELPIALAMARDTGQYGAYVMLGCIIRGETSHYDIVAGESARTIMDLAVAGRLAVGNGILTVENVEQALVRARPEGPKNKGGFAARAALDMAVLHQELKNKGLSRNGE